MKFGRNVVKEETTQKLPRWVQKVCNNKKKKNNKNLSIYLSISDIKKLQNILCSQGKDSLQ